MRPLCFVLVILAGWRAAWAAQESAQAPVAALAGTVVTPDNRPARGVTVALVGGTYDEPPKMPPVTCSAAIRLVAEGGGTLDQALSTFT